MGQNKETYEYKEMEDGLFIHLEVPIGVLAIKEPEINLIEKLVLACIMQNIDRETGASPITIRGASAFLSFSLKEVADAMFVLEAKGLVSKGPDGFVLYDNPAYHMRLQREKEMVK